MYREHVDLIETHEPVHDSVRWVNDFTHQGIFEFRNAPTRFGELDQAIRGSDETGNNDRAVVGRILTDERLNGGQIRAGLMGPEDDPHDKNCFFTSSCDTSWPASDCRRPSSIFAMKQSRSMASSIVACSGRARSASMARCLSVIASTTRILPSST